ncbi:MAG: hypothetical protein QOG72_2330 [Sphingomonadales bacterium]|jgi:hypothetical protein|nr:hypothetical protein [Sphingomonadales bacterium]
MRLAGLLLPLSLLLTTGPAAARAVKADILHTPWLGLRLVQDGKPLRLTRVDLRTTRVRLERRPFQILFPRGKADVAYQLCAWTDKSLFTQLRSRRSAAEPNAGAEHPCLLPGTGMADTEAGSGMLMMDKGGHNYLIDLRLGPDPDHPFVHYSTLWTRAGGEVPIASAQGDLYVVAFHDADGDGYLGNSEYDFLELRFER